MDGKLLSNQMSALRLPFLKVAKYLMGSSRDKAFPGLSGKHVVSLLLFPPSSFFWVLCVYMCMDTHIWVLEVDKGVCNSQGSPCFAQILREGRLLALLQLLGARMGKGSTAQVSWDSSSENLTLNKTKWDQDAENGCQLCVCKICI